MGMIWFPLTPPCPSKQSPLSAFEKVVDGHNLKPLALKGTEHKLQTPPVETVDIRGGASRKSSVDAARPRAGAAARAPRAVKANDETESGAARASKVAKTAEAAASRPEERKKLKAAAPLLNDLQRGQLVEARYGYGNTWYKGRVEEAHACAGASTKYTIAWCGDDDDAGSYTPNIPASRVRLPA